jgi:hypothetical protein
VSTLLWLVGLLVLLIGVVVHAAGATSAGDGVLLAAFALLIVSRIAALTHLRR